MFSVEQAHPQRRSTVIIAGVSALLLVATIVVAFSHGSAPKRVVVLPQAATQVTCGQTITVSIVVGNDLACSSGNGLNVGAQSITINLNGHTLTGTGGGNSGVNNTAFASVTVENGTVTGWYNGLFVIGNANKVTGMRATGNQTGLVVAGTGSSATGNVAFLNTGDGIRAIGGNALLTSNVVRQNSTGIVVTDETAAAVTTNQAENNSGQGIFDAGTGTTLSGNVANGNGTGGTFDGISSVNDHTAILKGNTANYNTRYGIEAYAGTTDGGGDLAKANTQAVQCLNVVCS